MERVVVISSQRRSRCREVAQGAQLGNGGMDAGFRPLAPEAVFKWDGQGSSLQDRWCWVSCLWYLRLK